MEIVEKADRATVAPSSVNVDLPSFSQVDMSVFEALPEDQREVFLMREIANLPFKEIAEITSVSENTVKSRMRYALERLQGTLCEYEEYARALR